MKIPDYVAEKLITPLAIAAILGLFALHTKVTRLEAQVEELQRNQVYYHGHKD